jgi:hypothetical protein
MKGKSKVENQEKGNTIGMKKSSQVVSETAGPTDPHSKTNTAESIATEGDGASVSSPLESLPDRITTQEILKDNERYWLQK